MAGWGRSKNLRGARDVVVSALPIPCLLRLVSEKEGLENYKNYEYVSCISVCLGVDEWLTNQPSTRTVLSGQKRDVSHLLLATRWGLGKVSGGEVLKSALETLHRFWLFPNC